MVTQREGTKHRRAGQPHLQTLKGGDMVIQRGGPNHQRAGQPHPSPQRRTPFAPRELSLARGPGPGRVRRPPVARRLGPAVDPGLVASD